MRKCDLNQLRARKARVEPRYMPTEPTVFVKDRMRLVGVRSKESEFKSMVRASQTKRRNRPITLAVVRACP